MKRITDTQVQEHPDISVVLPIYNECDNIKPLIVEIQTAIPADYTYEILCVDDCSTDGTTTILADLMSRDSTIRHLIHRTNFGQSAAVCTGFSQALGDILITLDSDLQNVPVDIPAFLNALTPDTACVCGIRQKRKDSWLKLKSSHYANTLRRVLLNDTIQDAGCGFRALRRECLADLPVFNGLHRFLPIILRHQGWHIEEIPISHRPRIAGVSKYGFHNRLWRGILDCFGVWWFNRRAVACRRVGEGINSQVG